MNMELPRVGLAGGLDAAVLAGSDAYGRYFNVLNRAFALLLRWHEHRDQDRGPAQAGSAYESRMTLDMLNRLLYTMATLRMKYTYSSPEDGERLHIALSESGFPLHSEIDAFLVDLAGRDRALHDLPPESVLKRSAVDHLFTEKTEPLEALADLSKRSYLGMLEPNKLFLPFVPGEVHRWGDGGKDAEVRGYVTGWGCYDVEKSCPFFHIMQFDQDASENPIEQQGQELNALTEVIREEGGRVPPLLVLATQVDNRLEHIHPKLIKRTRIGPFYTPLLFETRAGEKELTHAERMYRELFQSYGQPDDFILMCSEEVIFSKYQKTEGVIFQKVREIFYVPPTDREAYEAHASRLNHYVLMPHRILQNMREGEAAKLPSFERCVKIGYDTQEQIHEVH